MQHARGAPYHTVTRGKIECWHQTLKNHSLLENYYLPGDTRSQTPSWRSWSVVTAKAINVSRSMFSAR